MLKNLQLTYIIQDEVLMITTPEEAEKQLVVKVYPVADLVLPIDATLARRRQQGGGIGGQQAANKAAAVVASVAAARAAVAWAAAVVVRAAAVAASSACPTTPATPHCRHVGNAAAKTAIHRDIGSIKNARLAASRQCRSAIAIDTSKKPDDFWNAYFAAAAPIQPPSAKRSGN